VRGKHDHENRLEIVDTEQVVEERKGEQSSGHSSHRAAAEHNVALSPKESVGRGKGRSLHEMVGKREAWLRGEKERLLGPYLRRRRKSRQIVGGWKLKEEQDLIFRRDSGGRRDRTV